MNPEMRYFMHYHYGTGYMPCPFYGNYMGYGDPSYEIGYHHQHNPYYHWTHQHMNVPIFSVPLRY